MSSSTNVADKPAESTTIWQKAESAFDTITTCGPITSINNKVNETIKAIFPEPYHEMLITAWKVLPITIVFLMAPPAASIIAFSITAIVLIIRPEIFTHHTKLESVLEHVANGLGWASAVQTLGCAIAIAFVVDPQVYLIATAIHLVICGLAFNFRYFADRKKVAEGNSLSGASSGEKAPDKKKIWGLFKEAPDQPPEAVGGSPNASGKESAELRPDPVPSIQISDSARLSTTHADAHLAEQSQSSPKGSPLTPPPTPTVALVAGTIAAATLAADPTLSSTTPPIDLTAL